MVTRKKGLPGFLAQHTKFVRATLAARATARVLTEIQADSAFDTPNVQDSLKAATNSVVATYIRVDRSCRSADPSKKFNAFRGNVLIPKDPGISEAFYAGSKAHPKQAYLSAVKLADDNFVEAIIHATESRANAWKYFDRDVEKLYLIRDSNRLLSAPLFLPALNEETRMQARGDVFRADYLPPSIRRRWREVKKNLIEQGGYWLDWVDWYENRLLGGEFDPKKDRGLVKEVEFFEDEELVRSLASSELNSVNVQEVAGAIRGNPLAISINAAALFDQVSVEMDRVRSSMPNDPEASLEANIYLEHLEDIRRSLSSVSDFAANIDIAGNDALAQQEVLSLHERVVALGEWLVGEKRGRDAVSMVHFGLFAAFLTTCGVTPVLASAAPAAVFLGGKLVDRIKGFFPNG